MNTALSRRGWKEIKRVGGGRYSDVYLVETSQHEEGVGDGQLYAVKVVDPDDLRPPHNLKNEIKILNHLQCGSDEKCVNVAVLHETIVDGMNFGLVFSYYDMTLQKIVNQNLKKKTVFNDDATMSSITENRISLSYLRKLMIGILSGVSHIHKNGIIHRDLNLNNIMVSSSNPNVPVIIDFGIAYQEPHNNGLESADKKFTDIATGYFKAPELLLSKRDYSNKVDMWAVGIILSILVHEKGESFFDYDAQHSDLVLLSNILSTFGSPPEDWSDCKGLDSFDSMNATFFKKQPKLISEFLPRLEQDNILKEIFVGLTQYETNIRYSADKCLELLS